MEEEKLMKMKQKRENREKQRSGGDQSFGHTLKTQPKAEST